jgi:type VI secretion system secreted protein VgrG
MRVMGERLSLALRAGGLGEEDLHVLSVEGREGLSEPFAFDVVVEAPSGDPLDAAAFLRREAVLALRRPGGEERWVHGECVRFALVEVAAGRAVHRLRVAPRLQRLAGVVRGRIFQERTVPQVVQAILDEHGVEARLSLSGNHPQRQYVTQYRESDLAFVARLLAEEGIWYRFDHAADGHVLVLADSPSGLAPAPEAIPQRIGGFQGEGVPHVARLEAQHAEATGKATLRDFDFERPGLDLTAGKGQGDLEAYAYPGGYLEPSEGKRLAALRLEALQGPVARWAGEGNALAFAPGARVEIGDGPTVGVVRVTHSAAQERSAGEQGKGTRYLNAFTAVEAGRPWRPPLRPRPRLGIQTATVTGPGGDEIHVDRHGRIKVRLHWDRSGTTDDRSSCWVRVAQPWAGPGMGASRVPRVGQEVLVRWLEGDPDRPLVTGAVFNGANPAPVTLPGGKTRSVLRSDTSPGSGGSNELAFEDAAGAEEVLAHAQRDWHGVVEADRNEAVQRDALLEVGGDRGRTVMGAQHHAISQEDRARIAGDLALTVAGERTAVVAADDDERVQATRTVTVATTRVVSVGQASAETVGGAAALTIGAGYAVTVGGALNHAVGGLKSTAVAGASVEVVGASREESVGSSRSGSTGGDLAVQVGGAVVLSVGKDDAEQLDGAVGVEVKGGLVLMCKEGTLEADQIRVVVGGKTALLLKKSGDLAFAAAAMAVKADGDLKMKGSKAKMESGSAAGGGSAAVAALKDLDPAKKTVKVTFKDAKGGPALAGVKFELKTPSGDKQGAVDASGVISVGDLKPGSCELELADLDAD